MTVHELDRILNREDVVRACAIDLVDHRGESRRLAGTSRPGDEDEAARVLGEAVHDVREVQLLERLDLLRDEAEGRSDRLALVVDVDAEARDSRHRVGEVELALQLEVLLLLAREDPVEERTRVIRGERLEAFGPRNVPSHTECRRTSDRDMQVGGAERDHLLEQVVDGGELFHCPSTELSARLCSALSPTCSHSPWVIRMPHNPPKGWEGARHYAPIDPNIRHPSEKEKHVK